METRNSINANTIILGTTTGGRKIRPESDRLYKCIYDFNLLRLNYIPYIIDSSKSSDTTTVALAEDSNSEVNIPTSLIEKKFETSDVNDKDNIISFYSYSNDNEYNLKLLSDYLSKAEVVFRSRADRIKIEYESSIDFKAILGDICPLLAIIAGVVLLTAIQNL